MDDIQLPKIPDFKGGIKTTEFYVTLLSYALSALVMFGVLNSTEAQEFLNQINVTVAAIVALGAALGPVITTVMYIYSRIKNKQDATNTAIAIMDIQRNTAALKK